MTSASDQLASVFQREAGRCTATLVRVLGDVGLAEDAVAEAFAIAAARWPTAGVPSNPGGWIVTTARNRAVDRLRRESIRGARELAAHRLDARDARTAPASADLAPADPERAELEELVEVVADDQLRLLFLCCHPALAPDAQVALTLRLLGGLDTGEIARAFLVPEATMAQRVVRAKRKLRDNRAPYRIPSEAELPARLPSVLTVISLIFTEGHRATSGPDLVRTDLSDAAIRLARVLVELLPGEPEAVGLLALLLLTDARRPARLAADGALVRLADQDRARWDRALVAEGHRLVRCCLRRNRPGPFQIQAAIAAVHADAPHGDATDWTQVVALYDQLLAWRTTPIVALNRAVAIGELRGPVAGLAELGHLDAARLEHYPPYHAARADLLARAGRAPDAVAAYDRALELTTSVPERRFLAAGRRAVRGA